MPKRLFDVLKILTGITLSGLLIFLVFRNVEWEEFWSKAKVTDLSWVIYSIILSVVAYVARAYRWNILLEPLGYHLKTSRTTLAVLVGYLANLAVPRLGEITRCGILKRNDNVPMPQSVGSVVTERIIDLFTLIFFFLISLVVEYDRITNFIYSAYQGVNIPTYLQYLIPLVMLLSIVAIILFVKRKESLKGKFIELINGFLDGLLSLRKIKRPLKFITSTLILWLVYYLMSYIIVFSIPETSHLGLGVGFMLMVTGGIAFAIPVQSGFGTYHGMITGMLFLYGIDKTTGLFLATLLHTSQIVAVAVFGSIALIISSIIRKNKTLLTNCQYTTH